jgi:hypothetical protein
VVLAEVFVHFETVFVGHSLVSFAAFFLVAVLLLSHRSLMHVTNKIEKYYNYNQ